MSKTARFHDIEAVSLRRGIRLVHIKSDLPIATLSLWFDIGSRNDPEGKEGLAHFVEHLFMKTTDALPTVNAVRAFQAANGLRCNAVTSPSSVHFQLETMADNVFFALRHLLATLQGCHINEDVYEGEKIIIADERMRRIQDPALMLHDLARRALFPANGLAAFGLGTEESLRNITYQDVLAFVQERFIDGPKTFIISSPHDAATFASFFAEVPAIPGPLEVGFISATVAPTRFAISRNDSASVRVALSFRTCGVANEADFVALQCLAAGYLCGGMGSRLVARLRDERKFTYAVQGQTQRYQETGSFSIRYSLPKEHVGESIVICREEIDKIRRRDIDRSDLEAAKKGLRLLTADRCLDPMYVAEWYAMQRREGKFSLTFDAFLKGVEALTAEDLARVANAYLTPERMSVALIGDVDETSLSGMGSD